MAVWLGRGVDLRRKTPKPTKVRTPIVTGPPVDLVRRTPKKRKNERTPFLDPEDVSFALLAGPHALSKLLLDAHKEIDAIVSECQDVYGRYLPETGFTSDYHIGTFWECKESPFGLCAYDKHRDQFLDDCVYCHEPMERK